MTAAACEHGDREHGDRAGFLATIRRRQGPPPATGPHPPPAPPTEVPRVRYRSLDAVLDGVASDDADGSRRLLDVFVAAAVAAEASVHVAEDDVALAAAVAEVVDRHAVASAVVSVESDDVADVVAELERAGVAVAAFDTDRGAVADLAVTSASHLVAATGSVVVDSARSGSRAVSLLPPVHLCVASVDRLVADHADVLRAQSVPMPSCRVVVTGPSRTGDIEQRLTLGAHGPVALHVVVDARPR